MNNKTKKTSKPIASVSPSHIPGVNQKRADEQWADTVKRPKEGQNDYLPDFLRVMERVLATNRSFTIQEVLYAAKPYEIPPEETKRLFAEYARFMVERLNKWSESPSCYDWGNVYCVIS